MTETTDVDSGPGHARAAGTLIVGKVLATVSDALVPLLLVRLLAKGDVGVLVGILLTYATIATILSAGFPATLMYFMPTRDHAGRRVVALRTVGSVFALGLLASIVLASIGTIGLVRPDWVARFSSGTDIGGEGILYFLGLAAYPLGEIPSRILQNLFIVERRVPAAMWFGVFKSLGTTAATVVPLLVGGSLWSVVLSLSAFGLVLGGSVLAVLRSLYRDAPRVDAPISVREIFRFAIPIGLTDMVANLNSTFDRYLILLVYPVARLAEYQAGAWQIPVITSIAYMVGAVYTPTLTRLLADGKSQEAIDAWRASIQKVSLLVVPLSLVFIVGAEETMELLFTDSYASAASIFRCYTLLTLGRVAAFGPVIIAAGKPDFVVRGAVAGLVSNVLMSIPSVFVFGFVGPAIAAAAAFIPTVAAYCWYIARATGVAFRGIFPLGDYLKVLATAVLPCALAIGAKIACRGEGAALRLAVEALVLLVSFAGVGTIVGQITRNDWRVARELIGAR